VRDRFAFAAFSLFAAAGLACGQVTPGSFTPDASDDYESYGGGRVIIPAVFGGTVPAVAGSVTHNSVAQGDWFDFRTGPLVQAHSGRLFGVQFGFGGFTLDFTGVGGASGFSGWACAAGVGDDVIEFFDMSGAPMTGTFTKVGGFGAGGVMEQFSFVSPVAIGKIRLTGRETCFDDITYKSAGATVCPKCLADCDGSGSLDFFDFLCFQNLFAAGDLCADCDKTGTLDFFDFLCFQNEFVAGCPVADIDQFGTEAPPSRYCDKTMTPFPLDARPVFTDVTTVPSPLGGDVTFSSACNIRTIGFGWATWSHGYAGSVYYTNGAATLDINPPAHSAFYLYVEPNPFSLIEFAITRDGGTPVVEGIEGSSGAKGYGFCGGTKTINVRTTDGFTDFAVGEFGIAN
jgi:hypothetical protein